MARGGQTLGVALGVGALAGIGVMLLSRRSSAATLGSPRERPSELPEFPRDLQGVQFPPLVERWRAQVARRAKDLPVPAILEWILIESGGDMCAVGTSTEAGIFQLSFPDDARYGATLEGLRAICRQSRQQNPADISWMSESDLDMEVGAGIRKILAARDVVRRVFASSGVTWPEASYDFGSAVKQVHAAPAVITELVPKISHSGGPPASWTELRRRVMTFPVGQMGGGLRQLASAPSRHGLANRLEDTLRNAEFVGRAWGSALA